MLTGEARQKGVISVTCGSAWAFRPPHPRQEAATGEGDVSGRAASAARVGGRPARARDEPRRSARRNAVGVLAGGSADGRAERGMVQCLAPDMDCGPGIGAGGGGASKGPGGPVSIGMRLRLVQGGHNPEGRKQAARCRLGCGGCPVATRSAYGGGRLPRRPPRSPQGSGVARAGASGGGAGCAGAP